MKVTSWKNSSGQIYKYYGDSKPFCGTWQQVTENEYYKALQLAWANYVRK